MRTLRHPVFLICFSLFCANQLLELANLYVEPLFSYLDDLLYMPLVLTLILAVERAYFKDRRFVLPWHYVLAAVAISSLVFELLLPLFLRRHTADLLDVLAYSAGGLLFHFILNKPLR